MPLHTLTHKRPPALVGFFCVRLLSRDRGRIRRQRGSALGPAREQTVLVPSTLGPEWRCRHERLLRACVHSWVTCSAVTQPRTRGLNIHSHRARAHKPRRRGKQHTARGSAPVGRPLASRTSRRPQLQLQSSSPTSQSMFQDDRARSRAIVFSSQWFTGQASQKAWP